MGFTKINSTIEKIGISFNRSIGVYYKVGKIEKSEWIEGSDFERKRAINKSGLWEEYCADRYTCFGIRKVVYPDGQQFTSEVYYHNNDSWVCDYEGWHAIGEEAYAIQNKRIPYLLENNGIKIYKFVTEDGLLNTIDLGENYKKEILNSSPSESSDSDSD